MIRAVAFLSLIVAAVLLAIHLAAIGGSLLVSQATLFIPAFIVIAIVALTYITQHRHLVAARPPVWVIAVWLVACINAVAVSSMATRATGGGHVETTNGHSVLVVHGRVIRDLDAAGSEQVALWDMRDTSAILLALLLLPGLSLFAFRDDRSATAPAT